MIRMMMILWVFKIEIKKQKFFCPLGVHKTGGHTNLRKCIDFVTSVDYLWLFIVG